MSQKKILVVDDSEVSLMTEQLLLRKSGRYEILVARNGEEAVATAATERPDLILLDVVMPKMNGFEACRKLRSSDATRDTPIIMVTSRGEAQNVETGFEIGCNDYVTKPINGMELLEKIESLVG